MTDILLFAAIGLVGFSFSLVCVPLSRRISRHLRAVDFPKPDKVHNVPMPRLGGLAIFGGFWLSILVLHLVHGEVLSGFERQLEGLFIGSSLILAVGVLDDIGTGADLGLGWLAARFAFPELKVRSTLHQIMLWTGNIDEQEKSK